MSDWKLLSDDPVLGVRRYELELDDEQTIIKTEYYAATPFMEANAEERKATDATRWGDMAKVASIPMHIWSRVIAPRAGDQDFMRWWLNNSDNEAFRTRRGKI